MLPIAVVPTMPPTSSASPIWVIEIAPVPDELIVKSVIGFVPPIAPKSFTLPEPDSRTKFSDSEAVPSIVPSNLNSRLEVLIVVVPSVLRTTFPV